MDMLIAKKLVLIEDMADELQSIYDDTIESGSEGKNIKLLLDRYQKIRAEDWQTLLMENMTDTEAEEADALSKRLTD